MRSTRWFIGVVGCAALVVFVAMLGVACRTPEQQGDGDLVQASDERPARFMPIRDRGGAQLWGDNCGRCHNVRDPTEFTDRQWDVITHHMRVRVNLTAYEHKTILKFLQSAN